MTGRAAGFCAGNAAPGFTSSPGGRGFRGGGRGRGKGRGGGRRGWRNWFYATGVPGWQRAGWGWPAYGAVPPGPYAPPQIAEEEELQMLKRQAAGLSRMLGEINKRVSQLEGQPQGTAADDDG